MTKEQAIAAHKKYTCDHEWDAEVKFSAVGDNDSIRAECYNSELKCTKCDVVSEDVCGIVETIWDRVFVAVRVDCGGAVDEQSH